MFSLQNFALNRQVASQLIKGKVKPQITPTVVKLCRTEETVSSEIVKNPYESCIKHGLYICPFMIHRCLPQLACPAVHSCMAIHWWSDCSDCSGGAGADTVGPVGIPLADSLVTLWAIVGSNGPPD
jgi:hypothetical protein